LNWVSALSDNKIQGFRRRLFDKYLMKYVMFDWLINNNLRRKNSSKGGFTKLDYIGISIVLIVFFVAVFYLVFDAIFSN